ncbi:hypothetical protein [Acetobacter orientalis]|uniref:hypothetical protein n=1 Tax=Acetobacter orientalis TaxID=146474 RepID=UPI00241DAC95|nr:hypothetical protein [Acetobacter orientalis]
MSEYLEKIKEMTDNDMYYLERNYTIERFLIYINRKLLKGVKGYDLSPTQLEYYLNELKEDRKINYNKLDIDIEYLDKKYKKIGKKIKKTLSELKDYDSDYDDEDTVSRCKSYNEIIYSSRNMILYKYGKFRDLYDKRLFKEALEELKRIEDEAQQ